MTTQREHSAGMASGPAIVPGQLRVAGSPLLAGLIALVAAAALAAARWATWAKHNLAGFILVGRHFADPARVPRGIPLQPTYGYDGQYFYRLALDPVNMQHYAFGIRVDHSYRFMRIGYPALTWLLSAGQHSLVPAVLIAVNVLAVAAMGYLGGLLARQHGRSALWGLLLPAYFGIITSVTRDTAEPLAAACLLGGLLALRVRRPVLAALLLACGVLTRETVIVAVAAIALVRIVALARARRGPGRGPQQGPGQGPGRSPGQGPGREDVAWVVPGAVFAAWQGVIYAVTGSLALASDGGRNAGVPFSAPLHALIANARQASLTQFNAYDLWLVELAALVLCSAAALAAMRGSRAPAWEKVALFAYILEICLVNPNTWSSVNAGLRSFIEVYLIAVIIILSVPAGRLRARLAPVLPVLSLLVIAAAAGETQRRLTIG